MSTETQALLQNRINSLLNTSSTKLAYSFGRALRFKKIQKKDNSYKFYDLPDIKSKRFTTLGYGKKCDGNKIIGCGSNKLYAAPSYFDPNKHNSPLYTFGMSRPKRKRIEQSPGPKYDCTKKFGDGIPSVIFGKSGTRITRLQKSSSMPGPGQYYNVKNHELSKCFTSNLTNSKNVIIGHAKRFKSLFKDFTPGPGAYNITGLFNDTGMLYNSKYKSIPARSFLGGRNNRAMRIKDISPGPGQYNSFSIFDGYNNDCINKK